MTISRSTASEFPIVNAEGEGGPPSVTVPTLGSAGDLFLLWVWVAGGATAQSITASNGMGFLSLGSEYSAAMGGYLQKFGANVTATTAGDTSVTFTANLLGSASYSEITADEFLSDFGSSTVWNADVATGQANPSSATPPFPQLTVPAGSDEYAYIGYMQPDSVTPTGGQNPINGVTFAYSEYSTVYLIAFADVAMSEEYQPVGEFSAAGLSCTLAAIWQASEATSFINPPPALFSQAVARASFR